ncbi:MAG: biosynthetic-type acetolactate synthase large subunit [Candidatus Accumulibacter sp.]|jgi:acetolactate synthase-1/2/3 large subunit|nr:biosynthetic-type acetolactate synthase large subunit [Accumulibacter sp.]
MTMMTGAEIVIRCLQEEKVEYVFGYPGGAVLYLYDELFKQDRIKHILVRHEQAAVHAADAFSRSSRRVGVALVTSGPGLTNAVTGIATAYMDSIPLVIISGQVPTTQIGEDAFQECDTVGITRPCVKHNFLIKDVRDVAMTLRKAFYIASTGRPGPVVVDIPKDVTADKCPFDYPTEIRMRSYNPVVKGHSGQIKKAVQLLANAKRPVIYTGGGVILSNAAERLTHLTRLLGFPITSTLMGLGGYPGTDRQFLGMPGMHGTVEANMALQHCDVLLAIGTRFDDRVIGNPENFSAVPRKIIHVDIDPSSISKRVRVDIPIVGNVPDVLEEMIHQMEAGQERRDISGWWKEIEDWRARKCMKYALRDDAIMPQYVIEKLWEITKGDAIVASDVGQHQMWTAQYYRFDQPRRWLNSGGLGTMGVGLPYAIGAAFANPDKPIVCVTGDGSIQMCIQELSTAKHFGLPIKIIALNNRYLGMVRQWQEMFYSRRYSQTYMDSIPDFVKLAEAYGHIGIRVEKPEEVEPALKRAFVDHKDDLVFLDIRTAREANVFPMVAAGRGLSEMILADEENM